MAERFALLSSRQPRALEPDAPWLRLTFSLARAIALRGGCLRTSLGNLPYEAALYGAARAGGCLEVVSGEPEAEARLEAILPAGAGRVGLERLAAAEGPARDRAVMAGAGLVIGVSIRAGGQLERMLLERWRAGGAVRVVAGRGLEACGGNRRLLGEGVPPLEAEWYDPEGEGDVVVSGEAADGPEPPRAILRWEDAPLAGPTLAHFTRACDGPWPGQRRGDYLEDLWQGGERARRDVVATLRHILRTGRLFSSGRLIRGGYRVVSFTAVDPERVAALHRYRTHLQRWEFQPFGLVFGRSWLEASGARPVSYLPERAFRALDEGERPYFQKHAPPGCDYSAEEEWRVVGDLDFRAAPATEMRVVAPLEGLTPV